MKPKLLVSAAVAGVLVTSGAAFAATATATTDLNIRAGPGSQYPVIGILGAGQSTEIKGCLQNGRWCSVSTAGEEGWAYSAYLSSELRGRQFVLSERPADSGITIVQPSDGGTEGALVGGTTGAVGGALIGGPVGAAVGGVAGLAVGGAIGDAAEPPPRVRSYITQNRLEPVYLKREVVVGTGIPETVAIREIPDYEYRYAYVNDRPVLVDPGTRRIVYVMR
jgi:uncharacterized protein YraI